MKKTLILLLFLILIITACSKQPPTPSPQTQQKTQQIFTTEQVIKKLCDKQNKILNKSSFDPIITIKCSTQYRVISECCNKEEEYFDSQANHLKSCGGMRGYYSHEQDEQGNITRISNDEICTELLRSCPFGTVEELGQKNLCNK